MFTRLRENHKIPGMAVLQFGFGDAGAHQYLPHRLTPDRVVYTGTHDNDTTLGWWNNGASEHEKWAALAYLGCREDGINWAMIRAAQGSAASLSVAPLQDVLGLGSEGRLNTPSVKTGNFRWRFQPGALTPALAAKLAALAEVTDRLPQAVPIPPRGGFRGLKEKAGILRSRLLVGWLPGKNCCDYALRLGRTVRSRTWVRMLDICIPFSCVTKGSISAMNGSCMSSRTSC